MCCVCCCCALLLKMAIRTIMNTITIMNMMPPPVQPAAGRSEKPPLPELPLQSQPELSESDPPQSQPELPESELPP